MQEKIELLLQALEKERAKFASADDHLMQTMVDELVALQVYPITNTMKVKGYTAFEMVEMWGARWHEWTGILNCPYCGSDWRNLEAGPPFKRELGAYSTNTDRVMHWQCPDCNKTVSR